MPLHPHLDLQHHQRKKFYHDTVSGYICQHYTTESTQANRSVRKKCLQHIDTTIEQLLRRHLCSHSSICVDIRAVDNMELQHGSFFFWQLFALSEQPRPLPNRPQKPAPETAERGDEYLVNWCYWRALKSSGLETRPTVCYLLVLKAQW